MDGKPEFSPELRNNSMSDLLTISTHNFKILNKSIDELTALEHELELELENELEIEFKLELELAELARKYFNKIACIFKFINAMPPL